MVWIKKFKNDIRDYIVQEKEVEMRAIEVPSYLEVQQDYNLSQRYEIVLMQYTDEITGKQSYFWYDEQNKAELSPKFAARQLAEMWMKEREEKYGKV